MIFSQVQVAEFLWEAVPSLSEANFQSICGVPYTALPLATVRNLFFITNKNNSHFFTVLHLENLSTLHLDSIKYYDVISFNIIVWD